MAARPRVAPTGPRIGGLPAYTKEQFRQVRPNGNYQNYLAYIKRARGITGTGNPPYPGRGGPGLPTYSSLLKGLGSSFETPAQLEARANRMAQQQVAAQRGLIMEDYKSQQDDAMRRMLAFQSAGRAAAAMNASLIGQVGGEYTAGADQLSKLAAAGAASMAGATDAAVASANQATSNVGMPGVTVGGPVGAPGIAGAQQAGVENYRSGTLAAQALTNAGGFASAEMAGTIGAQNLRATQEAQAAYMSAMEQAQSARQSAIRELALGRPQNAAAFLAQLQDAQRQQVALAMSLIGQRRAALQTGFEQGMTKKTYKQKVAQQKIENQRWVKEFNEKKREYDTTLAQHKADQQQELKVYKAKLAASGKAATPRAMMGQVVSTLGQSAYDSDFQSAIASIYYGNPSLAQSQPVRGSKEDKQRTNAVISYFLNAYWPSISSNVAGKNQAALKAQFTQMLRAWFANAPLPALQTWKLAQVKG